MFKLSLTTGAKIWGKHYHKASHDYSQDLALFGGSLYLAGEGFFSGKQVDFMITKLSTTDGSVSSSFHFGGLGTDSSRAMAIDNDGFIYITGTSDSAGMSDTFKDIFTFKLKYNET